MASGSKPAWMRVLLAVCAAALFAGFMALGLWQVERRAWKHDLIERVQARLQAPAADAPTVERWPQLTATADEYRRVRLTGRFVPGQDTLTQAATALGSGFWVLTPLRTADGAVWLVNRGFVTTNPDRRGQPLQVAPPPAGDVGVTGLLRVSEPRGGFLRRNDAAAGRWYSRDVQAIAEARGLGTVAPYFIDVDADASAARDGQDGVPVGGLTIVSFPDNHLVYAITWFVLALMVAGATWFVVRYRSTGT